ncbi:hypothetical protein [uncultured Endozoicomonas sp.]|uniref:hypothetical protein n=1 Tax=uncultured Endozoicomonas sp. TaxID=432652 RepID=UPI002629CA58|nr:hypothetical protein [uncultured Endozoicomonas sp.]
MSAPVDGSTPSAEPSTGNGGSSGSYIVKLNTDRLDTLRAAGYSDQQIEALLSLADDEGSSLEPQHFHTVNKETLNALRYRGKLNEATKDLIYLQAPVALVQEVSDPGNWSGDNYLGPGASEVRSFMQGETVDLTRPSLDALMLSVLSARADILQGQLEDQIQSIQERNDLLERGNAALAVARNFKAAAGTSGDAGDTLGSTDLGDAFSALGATWAGGGTIYPGDPVLPIGPSGLRYNSSLWDVNIESLKGRIEALTSESQLDTTRLQQTINKYNQTFELLSNFINRYFQSVSSVIQNLR